jgi:hypothetical protein
MKKLCFLILLLFTHCRSFFPRLSIVRIQNDSRYDLKIMAFEKKQLLFITKDLTTLYLGNGKYIDKESKKFGQGIYNYFPSGTDSIVVVFDNVKVLTQSCNGLPLDDIISSLKCNIINNLNNSASDNVQSETLKSGKYFKRTTYKITQADYDRAVPYIK